MILRKKCQKLGTHILAFIVAVVVKVGSFAIFVNRSQTVWTNSTDGATSRSSRGRTASGRSNHSAVRINGSFNSIQTLVECVKC